MSFQVETKAEYTMILIKELYPLIYQGLLQIYESSKPLADEVLPAMKQKKIDLIKNNSNLNDDEKNKQIKIIENKMVPPILAVFQHYLKKIKDWNQYMINRETKRIIDSCSIKEGIVDLLKAVAKANLIIMTHTTPTLSFNELNSKTYMNIKFENFIHRCYLECAREFYNNPDIFMDCLPTIEIKRNQREIFTIIKDCIKESIRQLLPLKYALQEYLKSDYVEPMPEDNLNITVSEGEFANINKAIRKDLKNFVQTQDLGLTTVLKKYDQSTIQQMSKTIDKKEEVIEQFNKNNTYEETKEDMKNNIVNTIMQSEHRNIEEIEEKIVSEYNKEKYPIVNEIEKSIENNDIKIPIPNLGSAMLLESVKNPEIKNEFKLESIKNTPNKIISLGIGTKDKDIDTGFDLFEKIIKDGKQNDISKKDLQEQDNQVEFNNDSSIKDKEIIKTPQVSENKNQLLSDQHVSVKNVIKISKNPEKNSDSKKIIKKVNEVSDSDASIAFDDNNIKYADEYNNKGISNSDNVFVPDDIDSSQIKYSDKNKKKSNKTQKPNDSKKNEYFNKYFDEIGK